MLCGADKDIHVCFQCHVDRVRGYATGRTRWRSQGARVVLEDVILYIEIS
jgi:hypothetical protein